MTAIGNVVTHLRLPVQLTLAPLYLWGVFGAHGHWSGATVGAFIVVHVFLYGGTTLYNAYYDRDEGPIAGMEHPVPPPGWALPCALLWLCAGGAAALGIARSFAILYAAYAVVGVLYSYPRTRFKARPYLSTALIFVFQGLGGFLAGWLASRPDGLPLSAPRFWLMALAASGTTLALYPLTQVYQIDEDARRGDRTLAMVLGPAGSFTFALVVLVLAGLAGMEALAVMGRPGDGLLLGAGYAALIAATWAIGQRFARVSLLTNFRRLVALQFGATGGLAAFVVLQFLH
jgi:1,4-dihydroxy-2-naphthoate octaprenyltransferase